MQTVRFFYFESCPHCHNAQNMMNSLFEEHPEYKQVELIKIDEKLHPEVAECYDYYYVPTFFVGDKKLHEGVPTREAVQKVFEEALK